MTLTGNELTFECEGCGLEKFLDQLSMADMKCIGCIIKEQKNWHSGTFSQSTPGTFTMDSATSNTRLTLNEPT
jgi:hypothetical protein